MLCTYSKWTLYCTRTVWVNLREHSICTVIVYTKAWTHICAVQQQLTICELKASSKQAKAASTAIKNEPVVVEPKPVRRGRRTGSDRNKSPVRRANAQPAEVVADASASRAQPINPLKQFRLAFEFLDKNMQSICSPLLSEAVFTDCVLNDYLFGYSYA